MRPAVIKQFTGIRAFAALWVMLHHGFNTFIPAELGNSFLSYRVAYKGSLGVDLFFILSGFIMCYIHEIDFRIKIETEKLKKFFLLRLARTYPAHLFTLALFCALFYISIFILHANAGEANFSLAKFFYTLTLTNGLGIPNSIGWNIPSWSLSSEIFAYLTFPFISFLLSKLIKETRTFLIIALNLFGLQLFISWYFMHFNSFFPPEFLTLLRILPEFYIGYSLCKIKDEFKIKNSNISEAISLIIFIGLILTPIFLQHLFFDSLYVFLFILLIHCLPTCEGAVFKILTSKVIMYLGKVSFSMYIAHYIVLLVFKVIAKRISIDPFFIIFLYTIMGIILGIIVFETVEEPARKKLVEYI